MMITPAKLSLVVRLFLPSILLFVFGSVVPSIAQADSLSASIDVSPNAACPSTVNLSGSSLSYSCPGLASASVFGSLSSGTIGATIVYSGNAGTMLETATANAYVDIELDFKVNNGPLNGIVETDLSVPGNIIQTGCPENASFVLNDLGGSQYSVDGGLLGPLASGTNNGIIATRYSGGVADVSYALSLFVGPQGPLPRGVPGCSLDFLDPVTITGASVYDSNGNLVPGATLISSTGFNPNAVTTPEPPTLLLLSTGLSALMGLAFRRKWIA